MNAEGQLVKFQYTPQYWLSKVILVDEQNKEYVTTYEYDKVGNQVQVIDPAGLATEYAYDVNNNLIKTVRPNGVTTINLYNSLDQLVREIRPEGDSIKYAYDKMGHLKEVIDRKGQKIVYQYRKDYLPVQIDYFDQANTLVDSAIYSYDREDRRLTAQNADSMIISKLVKVPHLSTLLEDKLQK